MAKEVETRVVEMEFKNKDFEKAIDVTLESIDELNQKLDKLNDINISGFEELTNAANKVDFSNISSSLDYIASRFSILGIAAQNVKGIIVDEMMDAVSAIGNAFDGIFNIIQEKGNARAFNLEQAKFQLSNLGVKWSEVSKSIDEAVNDTRFGMDEAAMAASQLVASGVKLGDEMTRALLGISGVAAMTNSEYSDIAHIFTTIAGTGKVYTQQLNMIAARGLNATAALAKEMETTEAGVREILSDKDEFIDFATFARAMFNEYGAAAKKGNDLFSGALANAKAALGRIGEKFYTPFHENARLVLLEIKPVINMINKLLDPFFSKLSSAMGYVKDLLVDLFKGFDQDFKINDKVVNLKNDLGNFFDWIANCVKGIGDSFRGGIGSSVGQTVLNVFANIYNVLKVIKSSLEKTFGKASFSTFYNLADSVAKFTQQLILSEETLNKLERTLNGVFAIFDMIYKIVNGIFEAIVLPLLYAFGLVGDEVLDITANIGDALVSLNSKFEVAAPLKRVMIDLMVKAKPVIEDIKKLFTDIGTALGKITGIHSFEDLVNSIENVGSKLHLKDIFMSIAGAILYCIDLLAKFKDNLANSEEFDELKQHLGVLGALTSALTWIKDRFIQLKNTISDILHGKKTLSEALGLDKLKEHFSWLNPIIEKFKEHYKSIFEAYEGKEGSEGFPMIQYLGDSLKKAIENLDYETIFGGIGVAFWGYFLKKAGDFKAKLTEVITPLGTIFQNVADKMEKNVQESTATKFLKIAAGLALIAAAVVLIGKMDPGEVQRGVDALTQIIVLIGVFVVVVGKLLSATKTVEKLNGDLDHTETTKIAGGKEGGFLAGFMSQINDKFTGLKETITEKVSQLTAVPGIILSLGAAIFMIIGALTMLIKAAGKNPEVFQDAATVVKDLMTTFGLIAIALVAMSKEKEGGASLNAAALKNIAKIFLFMGIAVRLVAGSIAMLALFPADKYGAVMGAAIIIEVLMLSMAGIVLAFGQFTKNLPADSAKTMLAAGGMMLMMAAAVQMLTIPIIAIAATVSLAGAGSVLLSAGIILALLAGLGGIAVGFAFLGAKVQGAIPGMLAGAAAMLIMANAITMLTIPITVIAAIGAMGADLLGAITTIGILTTVMGLLIALFGVIGGGTSGLGAIGMVAGAAAMVMMAFALQMLLIPLAAITALQASGQFEAAFMGLVNCLIALGIAAAAGMFIGPGLVAIATAVALFGATVMMIGAGLWLAANAVLAFVTSLLLLQSIDFEKLSNKIASAGSSMIKGFVTALKSGLPDVVNGALLLLGAVAEAISRSSALIAEAAILMLEDVIKAIDNHAEDLGFHLGRALSRILTNAVGGVVGGFGDSIIGLFLPKDLELGDDDPRFSDFLRDLFTGKSKEVEEASKDTGKNATDSMFEGMKGSVDENSAPLGSQVISSVSKEFASGNSVDMMSSGLETGLSGAGANILSSNIVGDFGENLGEQGVDGVASVMNASSGADIANNFGGTLVNKLGSYNKEGYQAGFDLGDSVVKGAKDGTDMNSPSKEAIKIGEYFNQGLEIGLNDNQDVYNTSKKNAQQIVSTLGVISQSAKTMFSGNSLKSLSETIANIGQSELLNHDYNPTISPTLDLSNVTNGLGMLDGMFNSKRSIALAGEAAYMQEANRNMTLSIQNDKSKNLNDGMSSLGGKIDRLGEAILNRQIVLDSGQVVGGLVDPMDRALGVRVIRAQRAGRR